MAGDGSYVMRLIPADELALNDTPTSISGQWRSLTAQLLHELPTNAQQSTVSKLLGAVFQQSLERVTRCSLSLFIDGMFDLRGFSTYVVFVYIKLPWIGVESSQDVECFVGTVVGDEPYRR
jgi:hypothetical protein